MLALSEQSESKGGPASTLNRLRDLSETFLSMDILPDLMW